MFIYKSFYFSFVFTSICFVEDSCLIHVICILIYVYWRLKRFSCQITFGSFHINMTGATGGAGFAYPSRSHEFTNCVQCFSICSFLCSVLWTIVCLFIILFNIVLSPPDYPFGIYKYFFIFTNNKTITQKVSNFDE